MEKGIVKNNSVDSRKGLMENPGMMNTKKESTQSIAVSADEKQLIEILGLSERMKPATFARAIFFKGLLQYLKDRKPHAPKRDEEIYDEFVKLIGSDAELTKIKHSVEFRAGLMGEANKGKK